MTYSLILALLTLFFMGKTFEKMGHTFWEWFIPIYNLYILLEELERPLWWIILFFIPVVNIIFAFMTLNELARRFSRDYLMGILLTLFPFIGFGILAYSDEATYTR